MTIKYIIGLSLNRLPSQILDSLIALRFKEFTPILVYHAINHHSNNPLISGKVHNIFSEVFYEQLCLLKKHFTVVSLDELQQRLTKDQRVQGLAAVTFDDGYLSILNQAVPVLDTLAIPATFFLTTKLIQAGAFWRDKIRYVVNQNLAAEFLDFARKIAPAFQQIAPEQFYPKTKDPTIISSRLVETTLDQFLQSRRVDLDDLTENVYCRASDLAAQKSPYLTFGNHTHSHYVLSSMSKDEQFTDVALADQILKEMGHPEGGPLPLSRVFSIPFGGSRDFNQDTLEVLRDLGFSGYVQSGTKVVNALPDTVSNQNGLIALHRFMPINNKSFLFVR
jgi:peptidoglycan/xylan/chitin deacetylase (PgdA/CDA1 family)